MTTVDEQSVSYVLLYRTTREWRITVRTLGEIACGALSLTRPSDSFEVASDEFAVLLYDQWGLRAPLEWQQIKPDSWGADVLPGALAAAGEIPEPDR